MFLFDLDTLVFFPFLWLPVPHYCLGSFFLIPVEQKERSDLGMYQSFPFELYPLMFYPFYMDSCSSLKFGDFISTSACSLCGIGSGVVSGIFRLWYSIVFSPSMGCGGRCEFLPSAPSLFVYLLNRSDEEGESEVSVFTVRVVMSIMVLMI